ncbi:ribonuclease III [Reinekea sp.]|uniref:ribonuclease III n=1 Tax=Reinekea sp. TaxID=1970455 RepID=UPI003989AE46
MADKYFRLTKSIQYQFSNQSLLEQALSHRSFSRTNNERLEFLGDAILNCTIAQALYEQFPKAKEGQMSRLRAHLVKGETLAELGREFDLGDFLKLGSGELKSGGYRRDSILADAVEAIIGAISKDADLATSQKVLLSWYEERLAGLNLKENIKDSKTRLQEYLQARRLALPIYDVVNISGEAHQQEFTVHCTIEGYSHVIEGIGNSRRIAEQEAARQALTLLGEVEKS